MSVRVIDGIKYQLIEPEKVQDFVEQIIKDEWEPEDFEKYGDHLKNVEWKLEEVEINAIRMRPELLIDAVFKKDLLKRIEKQRKLLASGPPVLPIILRGSDLLILDGYARVHLLQELGKIKCLAYVGRKNKIKISKKMTFTDGDIQNYLKIVNGFGKLEQELIATLAYKKAFEKIYQKSTLISFPYKENKETEINNRPVLKAEDTGPFIKKYADQNSPIDSMLIDPKNQKQTICNLLQIKYLGKGKYRNVTEEKFIELLKSYENFEKNKISLVIVLDGPHKIQLRRIVDWLANNDYPFYEVVLICPINSMEKIIFFQLKPSKNGNFSSITLKKENLFK